MHFIAEIVSIFWLKRENMYLGLVEIELFVNKDKF